MEGIRTKLKYYGGSGGTTSCMYHVYLTKEVAARYTSDPVFHQQVIDYAMSTAPHKAGFIQIKQDRAKNELTVIEFPFTGPEYDHLSCVKEMSYPSKNTEMVHITYRDGKVENKLYTYLGPNEGWNCTIVK